MSSLRPSKPSGSKLPTVAKERLGETPPCGLKRPLSQSKLGVDAKKAKLPAETSAAPARPTSTPATRSALTQRGAKTGATLTKTTGGTSLPSSNNNLSTKGATSTLGRSNSVSGRPGLAGRAAPNRGPAESTKGLRERIANLEKQIVENSQHAKNEQEKLATEKEELTAESTRYKEEIQERIEEVRALQREKLDLTAELGECRDELSRVKNRLETKVIALEADNNRLSSLLEQKRNETRRLNAELEEAIREKEAARARMRENEARLRHIHNQMLELKGNIRVFARVRPVAEEEGESAVAIRPEETLTVVKPNPKVGGKPIAVPFQFDRVLGADVAQCDVFEEVEQLVISALDGYNICIFAYGQTGSGKTYTMEGPPGLEFDNESQEVHFGIIPRAIRRVFQLTEERKENGWEYTLKASFIEIYNETIQDLLDKNKKECSLRVKKDPKTKGESVFVENMLSVPVTSIRQIAQLMEKARKHRSVAATKCNERSSRSHSVFQLHIKAQNSINEVKRESLLNLVDLAGSERMKDSGAEGARLTETKNINSSLTQLSTVMMSLGNKAAHIPYRNSKLTHLLSTSLGGNSKTLMIVNVSPAAAHANETINSLKFAQKVNEVHIGPASKNNK